jgi:hypothetical protein
MSIRAHRPSYQTNCEPYEEHEEDDWTPLLGTVATLCRFGPKEKMLVRFLWLHTARCESELMHAVYGKWHSLSIAARRRRRADFRKLRQRVNDKLYQEKLALAIVPVVGVPGQEQHYRLDLNRNFRYRLRADAPAATFTVRDQQGNKVTIDRRGKRDAYVSEYIAGFATARRQAR